MEHAVTRFLTHVRSLWQTDGKSSIWQWCLRCSWFRCWQWLLLVSPMMLWPLYCLSIGERRWEHAVAFGLPPLLAWSTLASKRLFIGVYPLFAVGLVYDGMRFVKDVGVTPERVHVCDLHALDARWFGLGTQSWPDYWLTHGNLALDLYFAIPYGTFLYVTVAYAVWLYRADYDGLRRFAWTFLLTNLLGFLTYHIYPAAPPWYYHQYGCAVDLGARASEGTHLARVDQVLGVPYFASFYARSNDVFGAVPSLHVAYPLLVVLEGWRRHRVLGRTLSCLFFVSMSAAAVYLDHHWVFDVALGVLYTVVIYALVRRVIRPAAEIPLQRGLLADNTTM